jgi:hypothetical protein
MAHPIRGTVSLLPPPHGTPTTLYAAGPWGRFERGNAEPAKEVRDRAAEWFKQSERRPDWSPRSATSIQPGPTRKTAKARSACRC